MGKKINEIKIGLSSLTEYIQKEQQKIFYIKTRSTLSQSKNSIFFFPVFLRVAFSKL